MTGRMRGRIRRFNHDEKFRLSVSRTNMEDASFVKFSSFLSQLKRFSPASLFRQLLPLERHRNFGR